MFKRTISLGLIAVFLMSTMFFNTEAQAATSPLRAALYSASGVPGQTTTVRLVFTQNAELAAGDFEIAFDPGQLECKAVSKGELIQSSGNNVLEATYDNTVGKIKIAFINGSGLRGTGEFATLSFLIKPNATLGTTALTLGAKNLLTSALAPVQASLSQGAVYVNGNPQQQQSVTLNVNNGYHIFPNEQCEVTFYLSNNNAKMYAGDIEIGYDKDSLECVSGSADSLLGGANCMSTCYVNEQVGIIKMSFISTDGISGSGYAFKALFKPKAGVQNKTVPLVVNKFSVYDESGKAITTSKNNGAIQIEEVTAKDVFITLADASAKASQTFSTKVMLNADSKVGAMDFEIAYNGDALQLVEAKEGTAKNDGAMISIYVPQKGKLSVSLMCADGLTKEASLVELTFTVSGNAPVGAQYPLGLTVKSAYNADLEQLTPHGASGVVTVLENIDDTPIVHFGSPALKQVIISGGYDKNSDGELSQREMGTVDYLYANGVTISSLEGLQYATAIKKLQLYDSHTESIEQLRTLVGLTDLRIQGGSIQDLSPLALLTKLEQLDLGANRIRDISVLQNLTKLTTCTLSNNYIDLSDGAMMAVINALKNRGATVYYQPQFTMKPFESSVLSNTVVKQGDAISGEMQVQVRNNTQANANLVCVIVSYDERGTQLGIQNSKTVLVPGANVNRMQVNFQQKQAGAKKLKLFFWKDLSTMTPLTAPIEINL